MMASKFDQGVSKIHAEARRTGSLLRYTVDYVEAHHADTQRASATFNTGISLAGLKGAIEGLRFGRDVVSQDFRLLDI